MLQNASTSAAAEGVRPGSRPRPRARLISPLALAGLAALIAAALLILYPQHQLIERLRIAPAGIRPASFPQRRFFTLQHLNPTAAFYNDPFFFRLKGPLDTGILRKSFNAMATLVLPSTDRNLMP